MKADERWAGNKVSFEDEAEPTPIVDPYAPQSSPAEPAVKWRKLCCAIMQEQV